MFPSLRSEASLFGVAAFRKTRTAVKPIPGIAALGSGSQKQFRTTLRARIAMMASPKVGNGNGPGGHRGLLGGCQPVENVSGICKGEYLSAVGFDVTSQSSGENVGGEFGFELATPD